MPTYEYECTKCGHHFELVQSMNDRPRSRCPECRGKVRKLILPAAGYNRGLVGLSRELTAGAGRSLPLRLLLISIDRPQGVSEISLSKALEAIKPRLVMPAAGAKTR